MDKDYRNFNTAKTLRIMTVIILIICALLASVVWALFTSSIDIKNNRLGFGQIHVELGYYDESGASTTEGHMIDREDADAKIVDSYDYPGPDSDHPYDHPTGAAPDYKHKMITPGAMVGSAYDHAASRSAEENGYKWNVKREFYVENLSMSPDDPGAADASCYYRIYIKPEQDHPEWTPPYNKKLGDYLEVTIWEAEWREVWDEVNHTTVNKLLKVRNPADESEEKPPVIDHVTANKLTQQYYENDPDGRLYLKNQQPLAAGVRKDFIFQLTYSEEFEHTYINSKMYQFDICVEAVQAKNQDQNNIQF